MFGDDDDEYHQFTTTSSSFPIPSSVNYYHHPSSLHNNNPLVRSTDELLKLRSTHWEHISRKLGLNRTAQECKAMFAEDSRHLNSYKIFSELDELYPNEEEHKRGDDNDNDNIVISTATATATNVAGKKRKRNRNYKYQALMDLIDGVVNKMLSKQEEMQNKLIEEVVRRDEESIAREEQRKSDEMERLKMEIEIREREQACAEERQATIIHFLNNLQTPFVPFSPSSLSGKRWPKDEVLALINLRCNNGGGGKNGALWERISQGMMELGYKRSAKRCKEKWENINKYFRKTKDSKKKRSVESRTCPYFQHLTCLYTKGTILQSKDDSH